MSSKKSQSTKIEPSLGIRRGISAKRYVPETTPASSSRIWGSKLKPTISDDEIRQKTEKKAYELFEQRGCTNGNDLQDWLEAERIIAQEIFG